MNRDQVRNILPTLQAFAAGEVIQICGPHSAWRDVAVDDLDMKIFNFSAPQPPAYWCRVKPPDSTPKGNIESDPEAAAYLILCANDVNALTELSGHAMRRGYKPAGGVAVYPFTYEDGGEECNGVRFYQAVYKP